ncbi:hypothetical protein BUY35_00385 [Staphylococcus cohnii]|nr:hypothetical protein BUY35_00385 [Staphylococcus cohnii]
MARNKSDDKPFLKYYKLSQITAKVIKAWILIFLFIMVVRMVLIELISKAIHFIKNAVTSNPDGYLKDLFPKANRWGTKFDERFLFDIDGFIRNSIIISLVLLVIYVLFIMLRHRNGEQAPFINDMEAIRVRRIVKKATNAKRKKTYKDENGKERKLKFATVKANKHIRKCIVEIHTYNKYNAPGLPPIKTYKVAFKQLDNNDNDKVLENKIKYIHKNLNSKIDVSFGQVDDYMGYYTSNAEKQLDKVKESFIVKMRKRRKDKSSDSVEEAKEFSYPLTLFKDRSGNIEGQRSKAEDYAEALQNSINLHLTTKNIYADKSEIYVINTSIEYRYNLPPNVTKLPNLEELQTTLNSSLDVEGITAKLSGRSIVIVVPLPKEYQIPIDVKTMIEEVF